MGDFLEATHYLFSSPFTSDDWNYDMISEGKISKFHLILFHSREGQKRWPGRSQMCQIAYKEDRQEALDLNPTRPLRLRTDDVLLAGLPMHPPYAYHPHSSCCSG